MTFTSEDGATVVECTYDYMGRRHTRKITVNGSVTNYLRYIYRGYLQIAAITPSAASSSGSSSGTRRHASAGHPQGRHLVHLRLGSHEEHLRGLRLGRLHQDAYTYTPYGAVTANGNVTQPIQWSSEYSDSELGWSTTTTATTTRRMEDGRGGIR